MKRDFKEPGQVIDDLLRPIHLAMKSEGITHEYLARKLKAELEAEEVKVFSGGGGVIYSDKLIDWGTRQRARMDAHKLRGDYPIERIEISEVERLEELSDEEIDARIRELQERRGIKS